MIPSVLIIAVPLGIVWGTARNTPVVAAGAMVTLLGWVLTRRLFGMTSES